MSLWLRFRRYAIAVGVVGLGSVAALLLAGPAHWGALAFLVFPLTVLTAASYGGLGPGLLATAMSAFVIAFAFAEPVGSFAVEEPRARVAVSLFVMTSAIQSAVLGSGRLMKHGLDEVNATLRTAAEKYRLLFECNPVPIFLVNVASRKVIAANAIACTTYGYTQDELVGAPIETLFAEGSAQALLRVGAGAGTGIVRASWHHVTHGGARLEVDGHACVVPWPDGGAILVAAHDVTERVRASQALMLATEELQRAKTVAEEANQTKDRLVRSISHELRTPLTPVLLTTSALERSEALPEPVRATMRMIRRNVEHVSRLVDELLDASRMASGDLAVAVGDVDLRAAIERVVDGLRTTASARDVVLDLTLEDTKRFVRADADRLGSLLRTLLSNAVESSARGRSVRVWTRDLGASRVEVGVAHAGAGMTASELARVFEPFAPLEDPRSRRVDRLGLALSIGKRATEMSGGTLAVTSEGPTEGLTFVIELLVATPSARRAVEPKPTAAKRRILLVEDDVDSRNAASRLLSSIGHDVTSVANASSAKAAARSRPFDVVISDLDLPDESGLELIRELRSLCGVPGIALSGFGSDKDRSESEAAGFSAHLVKPVTLAQLIHAIERATVDAGSGMEATRGTAK
jgi:PAS domain S-box-containing protein